MSQEWTNIKAANMRMFYIMSGTRTLALKMGFTLKDPVNADALQRAARYCLARFENWCRTIVSDGKNLFYRPNNKHFYVKKDDGRPCRFCSEETDGYLFRIVYADNCFSVDIHHGVTDGKGFIEFIKTLLYYYFTELGLDVDTEGKVRLVGDEENAKEFEATFEKYGDDTAKPILGLSNTPAFRLPEEELPQDEAISRMFYLYCPLDQVLSYARTNGTSMVPILTDIIARTIRKLYKVGNKDVIGFLTADCRRFYGSDTLENFSLSFPLTYSEELSKQPLADRAKELKSMMKSQLVKENFDARLARHVAGAEELRQMDGTITEKMELLEKKASERKDIFTFLLTYMGKIDLPDSYLPYIEGIMTYMPAFIVPVSISGTSLGNTLVFNVMQDFDNDCFVNSLVDEFKESGIEAVVTDEGYFYGSSLRHEDIPIENR